MLITAKGAAQGSYEPAATPDVTVEWSYDANTGRFDAPGKLTTEYSAGTIHTPVARRDLDQMHLRLTYKASQGVDAYLPVNVTAPRHVTFPSGAHPNYGHDTGWLDAKDQARQIELIDHSIDYEILDQFHQRLNESAWGSAHLLIEEEVAFRSPVPGVTGWLGKLRERVNRSWKTIPTDVFTDTLRFPVLPVAEITEHSGGQWTFVTQLQRAGDVLLELANSATHRWHVSVDRQGDVYVTDNTFSSRVPAGGSRKNGTEINIWTDYQVVLHPNP
jgi:hypothetical protein